MAEKKTDKKKKKTPDNGDGNPSGRKQILEQMSGKLALKRDKPDDPMTPKKFEPPSVSAGPIERVIELTFNPSRDKIREMTVVDRMQGRLFPQLDMINAGRGYILEIAAYRQNPKLYQQVFDQERPVSPNLLEEFIYRTAQWQKSVNARNLEKAVEIALAEVETRGEDNEGEGLGSADAWRE